MSAYAIYRLPYEDHATLICQTEGDPMEIHSLTELNGKQGFVVAPFEVKANQPILVIQGEASTLPLDGSHACHLDQAKRVERSLDYARDDNPSGYYKIDFANYHSQLKNDSFRKIVLARCADEKMEKNRIEEQNRR